MGWLLRLGGDAFAGFRSDHGDELLDAGRSKHYALLEDTDVYGKRDAVHCVGCKKSGLENIRWGEVVLFNKTQWGLVGEQRQRALEAFAVLEFGTRSCGR